MTSIFSSNLNATNGTSTFGGTLFGNSQSTGVYGSSSGLFGGNTYGSSGMYGSNFGYGGYGYFGNTFGSYFGNTGYGSLWGRTTTPTTDDDTVNRTTTLSGTTIATKQIAESNDSNESVLPFATSDFYYTNGDAVASLKISDLPDNGTLELDGVRVALNQAIPVDEFASLTYTPDDDFDQTDSFSVLLSTDGVTYDTSNSNIEISVLGENDAPTLNTLSTISVAEGETSTGVGAAIADAFSDVDTGDYLLEALIELKPGNDGELTYTSDYGGATVSIEQGNEDTLSSTELATLEFVAATGVVDSSADKEVTLEVTVYDSEGVSSGPSEDMTVKVTDGNDAPTFKTTAGYSYSAVEALENQTSIELPSFPGTDEEDPYNLTYSIVGPDADLFNVDSGNGEITFKTAPDHEDYQGSAGSDKYALTLIVTDPDGATAQTEVLVKVEDVLAELQLKVAGTTAKSSSTTVSTAVSVNEGETIALTATMSNDDSSNIATFSIGDDGADGDLFTIDDETGVLSFVDEPDAENPHDNGENGVYNVEILLSDTDGAELSAAVAITVEDIHDEPAELQDAKLDSALSNAFRDSVGEDSVRISIPETASAASPVEILDLFFGNGEFNDGNSASANTLGEDANLSFELAPSSDALLFSIEDTTSGSTTSTNTATLSLIANADIDYDDGEREYDLTVITTDNDDGSTFETDITITLLDKNEAPEYFGTSGVSVISDEDNTESPNYVNIGEKIADSVKDPEGDSLEFNITLLTGNTSSGNYLDLNGFPLPGGDGSATYTIAGDAIDDLEYYPGQWSVGGYVTVLFSVVDVDGSGSSMDDGSIMIYVDPVTE